MERQSIEETSWRRRVLWVLAQSLVGEDEEILAHVDPASAGDRTDQIIAAVPPLFRIVFDVALLCFEYGLPPFAWRFQRFSRAPLAVRLRYIQGWQESHFGAKRNLFTMLRLFTIQGVLGEPALLEWMGYGKAMHHRLGTVPGEES